MAEKITVYDIDSQVYNEKLAEALKKIAEFQIPEWAFFVKTGTSRSRPPVDDDFWFKRAASILRQLYKHGTLGVQRMRTRYGGRKERGSKTPEFRRGSGKIIRTILQQGEKAGLVEIAKGSKKGRRLSEKGIQFLDGVASSAKLNKSLSEVPEEKENGNQ